MNDELSWPRQLAARGKNCQKAPILLEETQDVWHVCKTHTNFYRCTVEMVLTGCMRYDPPEGLKDREAHHWLSLPLCARHLPHTTPQESTETSTTTQAMDCSRCCRLEEVTGTSGHGLPDSLTVFLSPGCQASQSATLISVTTLIT